MNRKTGSKTIFSKYYFIFLYSEGIAIMYLTRRGGGRKVYADSGFIICFRVGFSY